MADFFEKWKSGLAKTSKVAFGQLATLLGATEITGKTWEDLETLLIQADIGIETITEILESLRLIVRDQGLIYSQELSAALQAELRARLDPSPVLKWENKPSVIMVVGVNGSGNPGAVAFNAVQSGAARSVDFVIIDTAGRLHTRFNLMEELKKVDRVIGKALPGAPHAVWLVLDATTGQNALQQAKAFKEAVGVTGVILAKLDSSARGGMAFAIQRELRLPILFAGLGEKPEDLIPFDPDAFVRGILSQ